MRIIKKSSVLCALVLIISSVDAADNKYYRYTEADGRTVITSTMNSDKAKLGYDIIDAKGRVIGKVDPELTGEELEKLKEKQKIQNAERTQLEEQKEYDIGLIRKYSFVADIEAEKKRKVAELQATLSIVKGNLNSVKSELEDEYSRAAAIERQGKPIPEDMKKRIHKVEEVVISTEDLYQLRQKEVATVSNDYDRAIKRFKELQVLRGKANPGS